MKLSEWVINKLRAARQITCVVFLMSAFGILAQQPEPWKQIPIPPLPAFHPAEPAKVTLANGVTIFLEEDHELPFIQGFIRVRGGSRDEPAAKAGLVSMYGEVWRTSGSTALNGDAMDDKLASLAASIETGGSEAATSISWSSFARDFPTVDHLVRELLLHPAFQKDKLELARQQAAAGIVRRNDDAASIAAREAERLAYGRDSIYGREAELATVNAVTLDDLKAWHDKTVVGENIVVGIVGDFDTKTMEARLRSDFVSLPKGVKLETVQPQFVEPKAGVYFIEKPDVNQSNIYLVGLGTRRDNPDYYALSVMNEIFSGGFGSRVVQNVRTKLGLAYNVGGAFGSAYDHPGIFAVEAGTKSVSTVPATQAVITELGRLRTVPPTPQELQAAKDELLNSFVFRYDSPSKVLNEQVTLAVYGYPADFLARYRDGVEKVTSADVQRVAQKYVQPDKLAIVVVGNSSEIDPKLATLGAVQPIDITIPGAPAAQ